MINGYPTKSFHRVFHIGTMNADDKGTGSLEGAGLSVSIHPHDWAGIARLSGALWVGTKPDNRFLDIHKLSSAEKHSLCLWGMCNGFLERKDLFRVNFYDSENDETRYLMFESETDARTEAAEYDSKVIRQKNRFFGTPKLWETSLHRPDAVMSFDLLCPIYAEQALDLDGAWWADKFDPDHLSAPRGVIVSAKLASWSFEKQET
jgi:hypothetical protein